MKQRWKRLIAYLMALSMATGLLWVDVSATEVKGNESQSLLQDVSDVAMEGSDSVGMLLSDALSEAEEQSSKLAEQGAYISDLEISGNQANVVYYTEQDAEIVVAVYDEETKQMLASGKVYAPNGSETQTAIVTIEGDMPQYYNASAFMLDAGNHEPLCEEYSTNLYNRAMQELEMSTVSDYDAEQVLNLDESEETNFVVYGEETKIITYSADKNQVTDNGDGTYVIVNADSDFASLRIGDIFSYSYQDGSVLIVKVKSISEDGTTVTITEDAELDLESVFDYVKIEGGIKNPPEQEAGTYFAGRGVTQENSSTFTASINQKIVDNSSMDGSKENSCTIKGSLKIYGYVKAYISLKNQYIEAKVSLSLSGELELKGSCKKREVELLPEAPYLTLCPGVFMQVNPIFVVEFSASVKTGVTVSAAAGMKYDSDSGAKNTSEKPSLKGEFKAEGAVFIGFKPIAEAYILSDKVGGASISAEAGLKLVASYEKEEASGANSKHQCNECLSGKLSAEFKIAAKIDVVGKVVFDYEIAKLSFPNILECYYSIDYGEFAWTKCPHKAYRITARVKDEKGNAIRGVTVTGQGFDLNAVTDLNGTAVFYLPDGSYSLAFSKGKNSATARFLVEGKARDVDVTMDNDEAGIVASGQCGTGLFWELDENGLLAISVDKSSSHNDWVPGYINIPWESYQEDIKDVIIEDGTTNIGCRAFSHCSNLISITIPSSVTEIGDSAFSGCSSLTSITIPSNVIEIGDSTFSGCSSLTSITIPSGVTKIGSCAFSGCSSLTSITIPSSVTEMGASAFSDCSSLTSITIPSNVIEIGASTFSGCSSLTSITIPSSVTEIGGGAFRDCRNLKSITIPPDVTEIGYSTFSGCSSLTSVTIPSGVTSIGSGAFSDCSSLTSITIPSSVTEMGASAFSGCSSLTSITIPSNIIEIGNGMFYGCSSLRSITLPSGVISIGRRAFEHCFELISITIPSSVTSIGRDAFDACVSLSDIYYEGREEDWALIRGSGSNAVLNKATKHFNYNGAVEGGGNGSGEGGNEGGDNGSGEGGNEGDGNDESEKSISRVSLNSVTTLLDGLPIGFSGTVYLQDGTTASKAEWADIINSITWSISDTSIVDDFTCRWIESLSETNDCELILGVTPIGVGIATITGTLPNGTKVNCTVTVNAVEDVVDTTGISDAFTVSRSMSGNVHIGDTSKSGTQKTASFAGLVSNNLYVIIDVKQADADDLLAADNLLYITQGYADISGNLALDYVPRTDDTSVVFACGYKEAKSSSDDKVSDGDNTRPEPPAVTPDNAMAAEIDTVILKKSFCIYNGKKQMPNVTVQAGREILVKNRDYTVSYANNVNVGTAYVTVKGIGKYDGMITKTFKINPKSTSLSKKITAKSKGFLVKWKKQNKQITGYELQYSTSKKFTKKTTRKKTVKKITRLTVKKLKAKKKYYVKIRTYKTVKGKNYYSSWSKSRAVTTKK